MLFGALLLVYTSIHFCCYAWLLFACQLFPWSYSIVVIVIRAEVVSATAMIVVEVIVMVETEEVEEVEMEKMVEEMVAMEVEEHPKNFSGVIYMERIKISHAIWSVIVSLHTHLFCAFNE